MKNLIEFLKIAAKDKVDMIALLILLIVAIVDLFTDADLTGGYAFFFVYTSWAVARIGYWKWRFINERKN